MKRLTATPIVLLGLLTCAQTSGSAQTVDATVQVNYEAVASTNKERLRNFENDVRDYISNYNWGPGSADEKIKCTLNIFIQSVTGEDQYSAQIFVGSQRPLYKSAQNTAVVRIFDESWEFNYVRGIPLNHNPYTFNSLTSLLDFYMYLIVGYDYDTYDDLSGTPLFQKASDIASLGRSSGQKGWQQSTTGYSRAQLINELLSPTYAPVREASWLYHFAGLDSLALDKEAAYRNIIAAMEKIKGVKQKADPRNLVIKAFFEAKAKELADVFIGYPDPKVYDLLVTVDPAHQSAYEDALRRRQ
jgi:hypothetical protein